MPGLRNICLLLYAITLLCRAADSDVTARLREADNKIRAEDFAAVEALLQNAARTHADNVEVLYRLGYAQFRLRKLEAARTHFTAVTKMAPPAYYSRYFLGRIALLENKPAEAVRWLEPIVRDRQSIFDAEAQLASAYAAAGAKRQAAEALRSAIAASPWDSALYYKLGRLYGELGDKELAAEALDNSKRLRSATQEDVQTLMNVSELARSGKRAEAVSASAAIRNRQGTDPNALVAMGVIFGNHGMQTEALDAFEAAASKDPRFFQAQYNRGLALLKLNRGADALEPLSKALEMLPQSIDANRAYGLAAVMNGRYRDAVAPLERVWDANREEARVAALLATAYLRTGSAAKAAELLAGAQEPPAMLLRVEALNAVEDPNGALQAADQLRSKFPQVAQAHLAFGQQLTRLGRYSDATPAFAEALRLAPGHPEAELGLADTLARSGEHEKALPHFEAAAGNSRTSLAARTGLARSLIAMRKFDQARQSPEDSVRVYPADAALRVELSRVYARLGQRDLAAEQTRIAEKLREEAGQN